MSAHALADHLLFRAPFVSAGRRWRALRRTLTRVLCAVHGHDLVLQTTRDRMFLSCLSCGHETPGWQVTVRH